MSGDQPRLSQVYPGDMSVGTGRQHTSPAGLRWFEATGEVEEKVTW